LGSLAHPALSVTSKVTNAKELREVLLAGHHPAALKEVTVERGCGPAGCSIDVDAISILNERREFRQLSGKPILLREIDSTRFPGGLPEMNWEPLGAYKVHSAQKLWGLCIEFSHSGLGQSGSLQRWNSVVLLPVKGNHPPSIGYRWVGYWLNCDALATSTKADEILLPTVIPTSEYAKLEIQWRRCSAKACSFEPDARSARKQPDSEIGDLVVEAK